MEKRLSRFAVIGKAKEDNQDDPFAGIDESKMDSFMEEMERDMGSLDEENPDPRQLGHFMRKMTDVMGDKAPPELREIVRRLEAEKIRTNWKSNLAARIRMRLARLFFLNLSPMSKRHEKSLCVIPSFTKCETS